MRGISYISFLLTGLVLLLVANTLQAQFDYDYTPYSPKGELPLEYLDLAKGEHTVNFQNTRRLSAIQRDKFKKATILALQETFADGKIYVNDPMTTYVRKIGNRLLKDLPFSEDIKFYVSKDVTVNATAWQDGSIIVNIGLLSRLQNEDQLAFVLAHEISHFVYQHPYLQFAEYVLNDVKEKDSSLLAESFNEKFKYVLQHEVLADSMAIELMRNSGFDVSEASNTLDVLKQKKESDFPNLAMFFSTEDFNLEITDLCQPKEFYVYKQSPIYSSDKHFSQKSLDTRSQKVDAQVENLVTNTKKSGDMSFEYISTVAHFEMVEQASKGNNYLRSTYEALILNRKFPDNKYLHIKIAENLHYINKYNNLHILENLFIDNQQIEQDDYASLCCFINKLKGESLSQMAYAFINKQYSRYSDNQRMIFVAAETEALIHGEEKALPIYKKYLKLYPKGIYHLYVKEKLR